MKENEGELRGVVVPVITSIDAEENVDEAAFRAHLRWLMGAGVHGLFVGGTAGEGPLLSPDQWGRMVQIAFEEVHERAPLIAGVMDTSTRRVCEKLRILRGIGYSRFALTPTFYVTIKTTTEQLRLFGEAYEAAGDMEMIAYNIPQCTGSVLAVDALCCMARRGWIRYCKESSGNIKYFRDLVTRGGEAGLSVLAGDELTLGEELRAGAVGIVPVCANVFPTIYVRAFEAAAMGDWETVARAHDHNLRVRLALVASGDCWLSGIKYAASAVGIGTGTVVSPLEPAGAGQREVINRLLRKEAVIEANS